jgi:LPS export ABC transporter protein LptC
MKRSLWWLIGVVGLFLLIAIGVRTCRDPGTEFGDPSEPGEEVVPGLTLRDVTLEQQGEDGELLWKVDAEEVTYSPNQEEASLINLEGELYQDGELLYRVKADRGSIRDNGQVIFLEDNIVATGVQNQITLRGQSLEWSPEADVLIVRNGLTGNHPQVQAKANEARVYDRENRMELAGDVVATTVVADPQTEPRLKLQGQALQWQWDAQTFNSDQPMRVERFENEQISEVLVGQQGFVELAENRVTLTEGVQAQLLEIPLEMTSQRAIWNVEAQSIEATQDVRVVNQQEQVVVTAQKGDFDLAEQIAYFTQDVLAIGQANNSRLTSERLTWNLEDQTVLAEGAVVYQQANPAINIRGPRARGRIEEQTVVIDGGQVITEIEPQFN